MKTQQRAASEKQQRVSHAQNNAPHGDRVVIRYFTDPLCCWSWGFEKSLFRLEQELGDRMSLTYVMGGLLRDWVSFNDTSNAISRPLQMAPLWMYASELTNTTIHSTIWHTDPPKSSYPSCIAVKTAALQSPQAEKHFLLRVREAVMTRGLNIARTEVIFQIANEISVEIPEKFSAAQFKEDWKNRGGCAPFENDLQEVAKQRISRYPTLVVSTSQNDRLILVGYRGYDVLKNDLQSIISG